MPKFISTRLCECLTLAVTALAVPAIVNGAERELFGFLLGQQRAAFDLSLGKSFTAGRTQDGRNYKAYKLPQTEHAYLVAYFDDRERATTIQLTGADYKGQTGLRGLRLGDDASVVERELGPPSKTRLNQAEKLTFWDYTPNNVSLEFTLERKLYSIQIVLDRPLRDAKTLAGFSEAREFAEAVVSQDVDLLMRLVSGDLLCGSTVSIGFARAARIDLADPKSKISQCLSQAAQPIAALPNEGHGATDELRVRAERLTQLKTLPVTKFAGTMAVKEIVYEWELEGWRVYEVTLR